jgi:uncharacterized protein involved in response to NO
VQARITGDVLRREPFRIFFPLAFLLGSLGVAHWVLLGAGAIDRYLATFHSVTQMQSFLVAFAAGFLLTALPKRTRTEPATWLEIGSLVLLVPAVAIATLLEALAWGQAAYALSLVVLIAFAARRFLSRAAGRRPPASFVLVPMGLLAGLVGATMLIVYATGAPVWLHSVGRALVFEGVFTCLVLGVGSFFLALALRGQPPPDARPDAPAVILGHVAAGLAIFAGLLLQDSGAVRGGALLRACAATSVLAAAGAWRLPTKPGLNRRLLFVAAWSLPIGLLLLAAFPEHRVAAMHVVYVGSFGVLAFAVAAHVTLGHGGYAREQDGRPWPVMAFGVLFASALLLRIAASASAAYFTWLGVAAALWTAGAAIWAVYLVPKMWRAPLAAESI